MKSCGEFLNQFEGHAPKLRSAFAYTIQQGDVVDYIASNVAELITPKLRIEFKHEQSVALGDYIVLDGSEGAYHVSQTMFKRFFCSSTDSVAMPGQPVIEEWYAGAPAVMGKIIKIKDRYFRELRDNKVITSPYVGGGRQFQRHDEKQQRELVKVLAELKQRKKKPTVIEVGCWSRDIAASEGGVL